MKTVEYTGLDYPWMQGFNNAFDRVFEGHIIEKQILRSIGVFACDGDVTTDEHGIMYESEDREHRTMACTYSADRVLGILTNGNRNTVVGSEREITDKYAIGAITAIETLRNEGGQNV